ncbi:kinase-like domain-containing protein, partial [Boletus edulis]
RIRRELGIWRNLEHPNIVPFLGIAYGFGGQGHASLVSLWMANGSLQRFLGQHDDRLTNAHRLQLVRDRSVLLHSFSPTPIIHGDLSSNNVLLDDNCIARLTDFGYTYMIGDTPEASLHLQMTTMRPGTLRWALPEHFSADAENATQPTTQSDIYSFGNLGLLASAVLTGKPPWSEIQHEATVVLQLSRGRKPKRPSSRPIEDKHWELIDRCWSSICDRPCAGDVVSSLQQFLYTFPPPLPERHLSEPGSNVQHRGLSKATSDYQSVVLRDGKYMLPTPDLITSRLLRLCKRRRNTWLLADNRYRKGKSSNLCQSECLTVIYANFIRIGK